MWLCLGRKYCLLSRSSQQPRPKTDCYLGDQQGSYPADLKKPNALRTLLLLCRGAYTFQRAVLLGLSAEEAGRMDLLTCEVPESATAKGLKSTTEKLPGLI